ncbi:MAG: hypothetical protein EU550_01535 [Promethearchaeota archaeon]|nr:MAG: hypothetical protein EU550_01535 [Candidatus Lokiarchaeota archaeon]
MTPKTRIIGLLTDFGIRGSHYVSSMKAVISKICSNSKIIDVSHTVKPFSIIEASYIIKSTYHLFPEETIFIYVIDPGVGSERNVIALKTEDNFYFIGPDNGILPNALKSGILECYKIQNDKYFHHPVSNTFHGRDIMAPIGAHIANNISLKEFGPSLDPQYLVQVSIPLEYDTRLNSVLCTIQYVDNFGNITTNIPLVNESTIEPLSVNLKKTSTIKFTLNKQNHRGKFTTHFSEAKKNEILFLKGSTGYLEISKNQANLAQEMSIKSGMGLKLKIL